MREKKRKGKRHFCLARFDPRDLPMYPRTLPQDYENLQGVKNFYLNKTDVITVNTSKLFRV